MTDAIVSEHPIHPDYGPCDAMGPQETCAACIERFKLSADAIARLTRERGVDRINSTSLIRHHQARAETAEAALSAARAELAECRNKALEEAVGVCDMLAAELPGEGAQGDYDAGLAAAYDRAADNIRALKEAPHV